MPDRALWERGVLGQVRTALFIRDFFLLGTGDMGKWDFPIGQGRTRAQVWAVGGESE